ncbi:MAG: hypothetical protein NZ483_06640 [Verrucomicrobiae bacterium]|nr:hypothetical protein [Verrucomicrobiae bacterium]
MSMDVNLHRIQAEATRPVTMPRTEKAGAARKTTARDDVSFPATAELESAVRALPDARPEEVARARELVAQEDYPPDATLLALARLLAMKLGDETESE